ncbi:hypothetical protein K450DRAFT_262771 [Umbelopsis ramanniana AG]|uniref:TauD/TfdA-like domain-containing protein n=1 Tax=Umbelopsis ramanniana AG TaxID=1314678 RepID=A0AAD5E1F4_UMBRA|nr:uncharacterized protein K450DRAFT_262771 [Umbelopsis ramanniana AG]KAI8575242.1 hypothetical protein K450DRAFT_262771 [Umbelopsis ramanniana AG]
MPPNTESVEVITEQFEKKLNLKELAHKGRYVIYPTTKYPDYEAFEHVDPGHKGDPAKKALLDPATAVIELTPHIGTEIHGLQLHELNEQQKNDLALLVAERGVVFFRKQEIDVYQGREFGKHFGPLHIHQNFGHPEGMPEVHVIHFDENSNRSHFKTFSHQDGWHSDVTYEINPAGLTFLKLDTLPAVGGDTLWASGYAAYDRLSPPFQKFLEGLEAVHSGLDQSNAALRAGHTVRRTPIETVHPVVRTHPVTGWKSLFVQPGFTRSIVGVSKRESEAILNFLYAHIAGGVDFQVRLKWEENTVAVWDNRSTFHNAVFDYLDVGLRHGWRITPQAEKPYFDPNSKSKADSTVRRYVKEPATEGYNFLL